MDTRGGSDWIVGPWIVDFGMFASVVNGCGLRGWSGGFGRIFCDEKCLRLCLKTHRSFRYCTSSR